MTDKKIAPILTAEQTEAWRKALIKDALKAMPNIFKPPPGPPAPLYKRLWWKITWVFELRIVHKSRIDNHEW